MRPSPSRPSRAPETDSSGTSPPRRRPWWRWIGGGAAAVLVLAVAVTGLVVTHAPGAAPLALPEQAAAPSGPLSGTGRTGVVTGTAVIADPGGFGFLGSLAGHGTAEFLLILRPLS